MDTEEYGIVVIKFIFGKNENMIINKIVSISVRQRNMPSVKKYYPTAKFGDVIEIEQKLCLEMARCRVLDCICDSCGSGYTQSATRILEYPLREQFCGKCMHNIGQEKMKETVKSPEVRQHRSNKTTEFYQTEYGKRVAKLVGERHSEYLKSRPDLIEKFTTHLTHKTGEDHPNFNPNKDEFQKYVYEVRVLTEKTYNENIDIINPNGHKRTLCGVEGGYQLDHIISVKQGFDGGLEPEKIADISNLQMLPWEENRNKWHK